MPHHDWHGLEDDQGAFAVSEVYGTRQATRSAIVAQVWIAESHSPLLTPQTPLGVGELMQLHRAIFGGAFPEQAGRQRTDPVQVGGEECCAAGLIGQRMAEFGTQLSERLVAAESDPYGGEERFSAQVELACWAHIEYLRIHPFIDGNGRTARVLLNIMLKRFGLYPIQVRTEDGYLGLLRAALTGHPEGFLAMAFRLLDEEAARLERTLETQVRRARQRRPKGKRR